MNDDQELFDQAKYEIACEDNFYFFVKEAWEYVDPASFIDTWHIKVVCDHMQAWDEGLFNKLLINIPPGFAKSKIISVLYPVWAWIRDPSISFLTGSNIDELAERDTVFSRKLIRSDWFQYLWGSKKGKEAVFELADDQDQKSYYLNNKLGFRRIFCPASKNTGKRCDRILFDDPLSWKDKDNKAKIEYVNKFIMEALYNRLNDPKNGKIAIIMQRLGTNDPTGFLLKEEKGQWVHLSLPIEFKSKTRCKTPIFKDPRTKENELLWPEVYDKEIIKKIKNRFTSAGYSAQYLENPVAEEGNIFPVQYFASYTEKTKPTRRDKRIQSWDTAFKDKEQNAYNVCTTWDQVGNYLYLWHVYRKRLQFPQLKAAFYSQYEMWKPDVVLVEDKASGQSLIQEIQQRREPKYQNIIIPLVPFKPVGDKEQRAHSVTPLFEGSYILFPENAPWLVDYINELSAFPFGDYADQVDSTTQALQYASRGGYNIDSMI